MNEDLWPKSFLYIGDPNNYRVTLKDATQRVQDPNGRMWSYIGIKNATSTWRWLGSGTDVEKIMSEPLVRPEVVAEILKGNPVEASRRANEDLIHLNSQLTIDLLASKRACEEYVETLHALHADKARLEAEIVARDVTIANLKRTAREVEAENDRLRVFEIWIGDAIQLTRETEMFREIGKAYDRLRADRAGTDYDNRVELSAEEIARRTPLATGHRTVKGVKPWVA